MILRSVWAPPWRQPDRWFAAVNSKFDRPTAPTAHLPRPPHCVADINAPCMSRRARASPYSTPSALPATATASADADWEPSDKAALLEGDYGWLWPYVLSEASNRALAHALQDPSLSQRAALDIACSDDTDASTALLCLGVDGIRANTFPAAMLALALGVLHSNASQPAARVAALWALARTHPARLHDSHRDDVITMLRDVAHHIQALPTADLMRLSSSPATTLVLLLSCLARLGVRPSTSLLTTVARALDTSATQVPTPALLSLLKTCCFFGMAPVQLLVPLSGLLQRRVAAMEGDWAPGDSDLDQVAQAVWLLGRLQGPPAGTLLSSCATVLTAHMGQLSPDAVVLCLHGFTRAGVVSDSLHRALWGQLAASRWQQLAPKQVTLALWAAAVSRQHPDAVLIQDMAAHLLPKIAKADVPTLCVLCAAACRLDVGRVASPLWDAMDDALTRKIRRAQNGWELANVAQSYARKQRHREGLFALLAARAVDIAPSMQSKDMLRLLLAFSALEYHSEALLAVLDVAVDARLQSMPPSQLSTALWAMAKEEHVPSATVLARAEEACIKGFRGFTPGQAAVVAWAFARLGHTPDQRLLTGMANILQARVTEMDPKAIANAMWALAKLWYTPGKACIQGIEAQLVTVLPTLAPQGLANVLWALARWQHTPSAAFWSATDTALQAAAPLLEPVGLAAVMWSLGAMRRRRPELLSTLEAVLPAQLPRLPARELANTLWGFGKMGHRPPPEVLDVAYPSVQRALSLFTAQELFNVTWSLARMRVHPPPSLLDDIAMEVGMRCSTLKPQELVNTAWAFARLQHSGPSVHSMMHAMTPQIVRDAPSYKPRYVATLLWATANLDAALPALLTTLVAQLPRCADMPQDAVMALTGLATCRHHPGDAVLQALDMRLASSVCGLRVFETGQALYGFACLGYTPTALLDGLHAAGNQLLVQLHAHRITQDACRCYVALVLVGAPVPLIRQAADALTTMLGPYGTPPFLLADTQLATMVAAARQWPVPTLQLDLAKACKEAWVAQESSIAAALSAACAAQGASTHSTRLAPYWEPQGPRPLPACLKTRQGHAQLPLLPQSCTWGAVVQPTGQTRGRVALLEAHGLVVELVDEGRKPTAAV